MSDMTHNLIIFDMDGVLVDSEPVIEAAAIAGLKEYGVHAYPTDFIPFIGTGEDKYIGGVAEKYGVLYKLEMKDRVYQIYLEMATTKLKIYDGIHSLLNNLQKYGYKMALASSADRIKINANLQVAKISHDYFSTITSGEDVIQKKPSPEIYLYTSHQLKVPPSQCIVVEDAINGIRAAKLAGMKCLAVATSFSQAMLMGEKPDAVCENINTALSELLTLSKK